MVKSKHTAPQLATAETALRTVAERKSIGKAHCAQFPLARLADLELPRERRDPLAILHRTSLGAFPTCFPVNSGAYWSGCSGCSRRSLLRCSVC
ncbi:MAG: hypothetical protein ABI831_21475 [Betaproteobacteria bacterium]